MKTIRLEFPLGEKSYLPKKIWLKVNGKRTEPFEDRNFTTPIQMVGEKVSLDVNVPKELSIIEIANLGGTTPDGDIYMWWSISAIKNPDWKIPGLKKVTVIFDDRTHDVPVINERPDTEDWNYYRNSGCGGRLFLKRWALAVYTLESKTVATFHWHPFLINELEKKKRPIELSKKKLPCMWEKGGQIDDFNGSSTIICDEFGNSIRPISIRRTGILSCSKHALVVIHKNYIIVEVSYQEKSPIIKIDVLRIVDLNYDKCYVVTETVENLSFPYYDQKDIDKAEERIKKTCDDSSKLKKYKNAIIAGYRKATCYKCKKPYFVKNCDRISYKYSH